jgi:hypothetical protein
MIRQNESWLPWLQVKPSWRREGTAALDHRAAEPSSKRGVFVTEKGQTFLKTYVIPVLLLYVAVGGWTLVAPHVVQGAMVSLGSALIVTGGLRLYLAYLDRYLR